MQAPIPYGRQDISDDDVAAVTAVLRSDWLTQGPTIEKFEREVTRYCGAAHGCAANSATSALHIACSVLGLGPGDLFWTVPNTFVASANAARYCGADVDFVDIDPHTYNVSIPALRDKLERAEREGRLPKVVMPVHFAGLSCDMKEISSLSRQYGFRIIEDASHAIGGEYRGARVGCCEFADIAVFSFHPVKIVTSAEGGMLVTNQPDLHEAAMRMRSHGITRDPGQMEGPTDGPWYYQQIELGYNYRMTDLHAALGISQMKRIDAFVTRRRQIAERYDEAFAGLPIGIPAGQADTVSAWHLYVIQVDQVRTGVSRRAVFDALRGVGIQVNVHYIPVHLQPYYRRLGFAGGDFPSAERYYERALSLPMYAALSDQQQSRVIDEVVRALA